MGNRSSVTVVSRRYEGDASPVEAKERPRKSPKNKRGSHSKFTFPQSSPRGSQVGQTITVQQRRPSQPLPQLSPLHITDDVLGSISFEETQPVASLDSVKHGLPSLPADKFEALVAAQMLAVSQRREAELAETSNAQQFMFSTPAQRAAAARRRSLRVSPDLTPNISPQTSPKSSAQQSPFSSPPMSSRMNALHISALSHHDSPVPSPTHAGSTASPGASPPITPSNRKSNKHRSSRRWSAFTATPGSIATAQFASCLDAYSIAQLVHPSPITLDALWLHYQPIAHSELLGFTALLALATDVRNRVMRHKADEELKSSSAVSDSGMWDGKEWDWLPGYEHDNANSSVQCVLREVCRQLDANHDGNVRRSEFDERFGSMLVSVMTKKDRERDHRRRRRERQISAGLVVDSRKARAKCSIM